MSIWSAIHAVASLAARGVPAVRSAVHGARIGAGADFARATVERLGVTVAAPSARSAASSVGAAATSALVKGDLGVARGGVALRMTPTGAVAASVTEELVASAARATTRGALAQIGRATAVGALGGAALDAAFAGLEILPRLRDGSLDRAAAAMHVGKRAARGAAAGAAGVAAAGAVSAVVAATGVTLAGAPVVVPLAAMVAAGALASRAFDRRFGAQTPAAKEPAIVVGVVAPHEGATGDSPRS